MNSKHIKMYGASKIIILVFSLYAVFHLWNMPDVSNIQKLILAIVVAACLYLGTMTKTYLPFLGPTVLPSTFLNLKETIPRGDTIKKTLILKKNQKKYDWVIYWAALPKLVNAKGTPDAVAAYGDYSNIGATKIRGNSVDMYVLPPTDYKVRAYNKHLKPHIHYRFVKNNHLSSVYILYL